MKKTKNIFLLSICAFLICNSINAQEDTNKSFEQRRNYIHGYIGLTQQEYIGIDLTIIIQLFINQSSTLQKD